MTIFISWSGKLSHEVALALRDWLPLLFPGVEAWVSSEDLRKGRWWFGDLSKQLRQGDAGIFCLTEDNLRSPWINFEAGAISKALAESALWTLLLGGLSADAVRGPFEQFQHTTWEKSDVRRLVRSIDVELGTPRPQPQLDTLFDTLWPQLEARINQAIAENPQVVYLADLGRASEIIVKRTFQNAVIKGPGIIYPQNCSFKGGRFDVLLDIESILWPVDGNRTEAVVGVIGFVQCAFIDCVFQGVGITGSPESLELFRRQLSGTAEQ
jgi:hypothetical protein